VSNCLTTLEFLPRCLLYKLKIDSSNYLANIFFSVKSIIEYPCPISRTFLDQELISYRSIVVYIVVDTTSSQRIIIGADRRPETKQGIEGKIDRFRSGRVSVRVRVRFRSPI